MNFKFLSVLVAVLLAAQGTNAGLTEAQKKTLLKSVLQMKKINWDDNLAAEAQKYANKCRGMVHAGVGGENLAGHTSKVSPDYLFNLWMKEKNDFLKYGNPNKFSSVNANGKAIGHYTQIVWAENTKVGCGFASCSNYKSYLVCRYGKGNIIGKPVYKKTSKRSIEYEEEVEVEEKEVKMLPISYDRCGSGIGKCAPGLCCSRYGWCGSTEQHCDTGCQSEFGECH
ncbi:carbohydrate-binding module family 18 protein [Piromyces sp. E2]|nr:carbohydrate-binding module family 18 protein [Piromyces sp. E2]|eukprot:OUM65858.1 carbohydrate-binding module family 18 protein [Piromyces sp. E2]